jgi:hypothetical protein
VFFSTVSQVQPYGTGVMLEDLFGNTIYMNQPAPRGRYATARWRGSSNMPIPP